MYIFKASDACIYVELLMQYVKPNDAYIYVELLMQYLELMMHIYM